MYAFFVMVRFLMMRGLPKICFVFVEWSSAKVRFGFRMMSTF